MNRIIDTLHIVFTQANQFKDKKISPLHVIKMWHIEQGETNSHRC